jgi:hypothetical protein
MSEVVAFAIRARNAALVLAAVLSAGMIVQMPSAEAAGRNARSAYTITSSGDWYARGARFAARPRAQMPRARSAIRTIPLWSAGFARW